MRWHFVRVAKSSLVGRLICVGPSFLPRARLFAMHTLSFVLLFHALLQPSTPSDTRRFPGTAAASSPTPHYYCRRRLEQRPPLSTPHYYRRRLPPPVNAADITWRLADDANQDCNAVCNSISKRC